MGGSTGWSRRRGPTLDVDVCCDADALRVPDVDILAQGLADLGSVCEHVLKEFEAETARFEQDGPAVDQMSTD